MTDQNTSLVNDSSKIFEDLSASFEEFEKAKKQFTKEFNKIFFKCIKRAFEIYPKMHAIVWCQYAPYFNDGEPCEFHVREPEYILIDENDKARLDEFNLAVENGEIDKIMYELTSDTRYSPSFDKFADQFGTYVCSENIEGLMKDLFGDDAYVLCTRDGIESGSYEDYHE